MKKAISLILAAVVLFSFAACGKKEVAPTAPQTDANGEQALAPGETRADVDVVTDAATTEAQTAQGETATDGEATTEGETVPAVPKTVPEIIAAYTEVMNYAKTARPGFTKIEYQVLPEDKRNFDSGFAKTILNIAANFMTTEADAKANPEVREKGNDCKWFPVYKCSKGCLLTDANAVKSAKCDQLSNGNYRITLVLKPEMNPEPVNSDTNVSPSRHGEVFSPLSKKEIDDTITNNKLVNVVVKSAKYDLKYYDCTAVLVYNPANNQIESLIQYNHVLIDADADLRIGGRLQGNAVLDNTLVINNFIY